MPEHVYRPAAHAPRRRSFTSTSRRTRMGVRSAFVGALALAGLGSGAAIAPAAEGHEPGAGRVEALDTFVTTQMDRLHIPGLALVLIEDGHITHEQGYGVADTTGRQVTTHTPFIIGSTSKQLAGLAVQQLVQAGTLELDAPLSRYLSDFQNADEAHQSITVRQLLGHTSGFSRVQGDEPLVSGDTLETHVRRLSQAPLAHAPGTMFEYSSANYNVLGYLVQEISGLSYAQYLEQHVLAPLGMNETFTSLADAKAAGLADGFYPWFGAISLPAPDGYTETGLPSGTVISSANDLARVALAQLGDIPEGQADVNGELLAATRASLSRQDDVQEYASGWHVHRFWPAITEGDPNDPTLPMMYEHGGNTPTFASFVAYVPESGFGIALTANVDDEVVPSRWRNFVFDTMRVAVGTPPRMVGPTEDLVRQLARPLYALGILLQLVTAIWSLRDRRRLPIVLAAVASAGVLAFMLVYAPIVGDTSVAILLRVVPDLALMTVAAVLVAVLWLALMLRSWLSDRRGRTTDGAGAAAPPAPSA